MKVLTTEQVAKICKVSRGTVSMWFDKGLLRGYTNPGSGHRRIPYGNLITFMTRNNMPLTLLEEEEPEEPAVDSK